MNWVLPIQDKSYPPPSYPFCRLHLAVLREELPLQGFLAPFSMRFPFTHFHTCVVALLRTHRAGSSFMAAWLDPLNRLAVGLCFPMFPNFIQNDIYGFSPSHWPGHLSALPVTYRGIEQRTKEIPSCWYLGGTGWWWKPSLFHRVCQGWRKKLNLPFVSIASALSMLPYQLSSFAEYQPNNAGTWRAMKMGNREQESNASTRKHLY